MFPIVHNPLPVDHERRIHDLVTATRLVHVSGADLRAALARSGTGTTVPVERGRLELRTLFTPIAGTAGRWRAQGRLHGHGLRLVPYARVEVEVAPWSPDASELRLRPVTRSPHAWGVRRLRRYLRAAPAAVAALAGHLAVLAEDRLAPAGPLEAPAHRPVAAPQDLLVGAATAVEPCSSAA